MLRTRRLSRSWGNCCHSCKITVLNSSIFWHFGLRWLIFRPIKSHTGSIGFMSGDIAGHGIVWTASCCKKKLYNSGSMWPTVEMEDYAWSEHIVTVFLACQITIKNVQVQLTVKGKTTPDSYTPPPKAVVPKMWLSWYEVFRWRQTLAQPSVGRNKKTTFIRPVDPSPCANSPPQMIMWPVKSSMAMT